MTEATSSLWRATASQPTFPQLPGDLDVDIAIVGAGITGLTAAAHLLAAGRNVAVLEMRQVGAGETGQTTAHLTEAYDTRFSTIIKDFSDENAGLVARSQRAAIDEIARLAAVHDIACGFTRVPGFLYTERRRDLDLLREELEASRRAGVAAHWVETVPLPYRVAGAIRYDNQARMHALRYLWGLAEALAERGVRIFEQTKALSVAEDESCRVETDRGVVTARHVVVAANVPVNNRVFTHTFLYPYRSYAIAAPVLGPRFDGLFWDTDDPYHYTRVEEVDGVPLLIVGGEDHKTGTEADTGRCYEALERHARDRFDLGDVAFRWSGQIIETADGLPCIGRNALESRVFIAGGYSGNGITFGTFAGMLLADLVLGRDNPAADLFKPTRFTPMASAKDYLLENVDFPRYFVLDRLTNANVDGTSVDEVAPGEGRLLAIEGEKLAVYRDADGAIHALSPVCTHMACDVRWNAAERSWDCPCHGSRFSQDGHVINGPAVRDLEPKQIPQAVRRK